MWQKENGLGIARTSLPARPRYCAAAGCMTRQMGLGIILGGKIVGSTRSSVLKASGRSAPPRPPCTLPWNVRFRWRRADPDAPTRRPVPGRGRANGKAGSACCFARGRGNPPRRAAVQGSSVQFDPSSGHGILSRGRRGALDPCPAIPGRHLPSSTLTLVRAGTSLAETAFTFRLPGYFDSSVISSALMQA